MDKYRAIIIEDEFFVADQLRDIVESNDIEVVAVCYSAEDFNQVDLKKVDFVFVDIHLEGEINGVQLAQVLNKNQVPFVFVTANKEAELLEEAARTFPVSYLSKPFKVSEIEVAIALLKARARQYIVVHPAKGDLKINFDDIYYYKSENVYVEIYTKDKKYTERILLKDILSISPPNFVRVHRSFVVNNNKIVSQKSNTLDLGEYEVPCSKRYFISK